MNLYNSLRVGMSNDIARDNGQNGCNMHFYKVAAEIQKNRKKALEFINVVTYRDLCRLIARPDRPNMASPTFGMKALMNLCNSLCVGMSSHIPKGDVQNVCNLHSDRFAQEFQENRKKALK